MTFNSCNLNSKTETGRVKIKEMKNKIAKKWYNADLGVSNYDWHLNSIT